MSELKAKWVVKSSTRTLNATPADVFPLLCPVREYEWLEPWSCDTIFPTSRVAENNVVFKTRFTAQGGEKTWVVCRQGKDRAIAFIRVTHGLEVNRLDVALSTAQGAAVVTWTHSYTGLIEAENRWRRKLTDGVYRSGKVMIEKLLYRLEG